MVRLLVGVLPPKVSVSIVGIFEVIWAVTLVRLSQSKKAKPSRVVKLVGKVILGRLVHSLKATSPLLVKLAGKVTLVRLLHRQKTKSSIIVIPSGKVYHFYVSELSSFIYL